MQKLLTVLSLTILLLFYPSVSLADTLSNGNYNLHLDHIEIKGGINDNQIISPSPSKAPQPSPPTPQPFVMLPPQQSTLSIFISQDMIDYGTLNPTNPVLRLLTTGIETANTGGYTLLLGEDHELVSSPAKVFIPDASCDTGTCSLLHAAPWTNPLTYGFGYRCDKGNGHCTPDFFPDTNYRPLANSSRQEQGAAIASAASTAHDVFSLSFKGNIAGTLAKGFYTNTLTFLAVPNL